MDLTVQKEALKIHINVFKIIIILFQKESKGYLKKAWFDRNLFSVGSPGRILKGSEARRTNSC